MKEHIYLFIKDLDPSDPFPAKIKNRFKGEFEFPIVIGKQRSRYIPNLTIVEVECFYEEYELASPLAYATSDTHEATILYDINSEPVVVPAYIEYFNSYDKVDKKYSAKVDSLELAKQFLADITKEVFYDVDNLPKVEAMPYD